MLFSLLLGFGLHCFPSLSFAWWYSLSVSLLYVLVCSVLPLLCFCLLCFVLCSYLFFSFLCVLVCSVLPPLCFCLLFSTLSLLLFALLCPLYALIYLFCPLCASVYSFLPSLCFSLLFSTLFMLLSAPSSSLYAPTRSVLLCFPLLYDLVWWSALFHSTITSLVPPPLCETLLQRGFILRCPSLLSSSPLLSPVLWCL